MIKVKDNIIFKNRKVLVVGLARSGAGAVNLLSFLGADVTVTDSRPRNALMKYIEKLPPEIKVVAGGNPEELFELADLIVVSPGVPLDIPLLKHARRKGVPVIGELELAYKAVMSDELRVMNDMKNSLQGTHDRLPLFIGITGTNGKSTVTTLVDLMLKESGKQTILGGNIGQALTEEILLQSRADDQRSIETDCIVAEISSFQLESIDGFRPGVGVILNITPDHLDRYKGMQDYIDAKAGIFKNQTAEDILILNADDPLIMDLYESRISGSAGPDVFFFSRKKEVRGIYCKGSVIYCDISGVPGLEGGLPFMAVDEIRIKGVHNLENAMAASLTAILGGCSAAAAREVLGTFSGLEHRLEFVEEIDGVRYINDSKGTNAGAVAKSLEGLDHVLLIMGGLDKNSDFTILHDLVKSRVKALILIGEAADIIDSVLGSAVLSFKASSLEDAVRLSASKASAGDTVLLSPGCASFDMFRDFEERGRKFKEAVRSMLK